MERKAYKYRCYPTADQARELARTFGCVRYVYHWALALRTEAWFDRHERIDYAETDRLLVRMKKGRKSRKSPGWPKSPASRSNRPCGI